MLRRGTSLLSSLLRPRERLVVDDLPASETAEKTEPRTKPSASRRAASLIDDEGSAYSPPAPLPVLRPASPAASPVSSPGGYDTVILTGAQNNEAILESFNADLLRLINLTQSTLTRAGRPQTGNGESVVSPLQKGIEIAERIEQRGRSLLVETSLTADQRPRVLCAAQNAQDQSVALRSARYTWQICAILTAVAGGSGTYARIKRLVVSVTELTGKVSAVLETGQGSEKAVAAEAAAHYRTVLSEQREILTVLKHDISASPLARRLGRAAVMSLVIAGESMTRVAARLAYPESATQRGAGPRRHDVNHGILRPLPSR